MMTRDELAQCYRALIEEKELQKRVLDGLDDQGLEVSLTDALGDLSSYDNHPADHGTETFEREKNVGLQERAKRVLDMVEHALQRMEQGTYTTCENCGHAIDTARLLALPYTTRCIRCEEQWERQFHTDDGVRTDEEGGAGLSFAHSFLDGTDETGYDGEDAWQEVARYGTANSPQDVPDAKDYGDVFIDADEDVGYVTELDGITGGIDPQQMDEDDGMIHERSQHKERMHDPSRRKRSRLPREGETW